MADLERCDVAIDDQPLPLRFVELRADLRDFLHEASHALRRRLRMRAPRRTLRFYFADPLCQRLLRQSQHVQVVCLRAALGVNLHEIAAQFSKLQSEALGARFGGCEQFDWNCDRREGRVHGVALADGAALDDFFLRAAAAGRKEL